MSYYKRIIPYLLRRLSDPMYSYNYVPLEEVARIFHLQVFLYLRKNKIEGGVCRITLAHLLAKHADELFLRRISWLPFYKKVKKEHICNLNVFSLHVKRSSNKELFNKTMEYIKNLSDKFFEENFCITPAEWVAVNNLFDETQKESIHEQL